MAIVESWGTGSTEPSTKRAVHTSAALTHLDTCSDELQINGFLLGTW